MYGVEIGFLSAQFYLELSIISEVAAGCSGLFNT
jgi:hypothetical protein